MVILYSSVLILTLFLLTGIFVAHQNHTMQAQREEAALNTITQFQIFSDQYVLSRMYGIVSKGIFRENSYGINVVEDTWAYKYKTNFEDALSIRSFLSSIQLENEFIESIIVYNRTHDTYIASDLGIFYHITERKENFKNIIHYDLIEGLKDAQTNQFFISPEENKSFYNKREVASFVQLMPIFWKPSLYDMAFIIHIDMDKIFSNYFSSINTEKDHFIILDENNKILFNTDKEGNFDIEEILNTTIHKESSGQLTEYKGFQALQTHWISSKVGTWKYVYTTKDTSFIQTVITSVGYILLIALVLTIAAIYLIAIFGKWLYKPLRNLVRISKKRTNALEDFGDITTISEAFTNINTKLGQLEEVVEKNDGLIMNHTMNDLISGKITTLEELNARLKFLGRAFSEVGFYILIIKIDAQIYGHLNYEEKELMHITIRQMLEAYYESVFKDQFKAAIVFDYEGYFTCIVNVAPQDYKEENAHAKAILDKLNTNFTAVFNVAMTQSFTDLSYFHKFHHEALEYFKYSFIYGMDNVFTKENIEQYENNSSHFDVEIIKNFEMLLKTQKFELLKTNIENLFSQIKTKGFSFLYMYNLSIQIIGLIANECFAQNITKEELSQHVLLESYSKIHSIEECLEWFKKVIDQYEIAISERNLSMEQTIIQDIIKYIKENVDDQLSLNSVADSFNMSTGHLSRLFKEKAGTNFSDFVSSVKFEKAAHLLLKDTKKKVSEIADELGYSNLTYFTKLFKEKYGMTPTQYRKLHKQE